MVVTIVPSIVARGIVFSALCTLEPGMVAHSIPRKAKSVVAAVAVIAWKEDMPLILKGTKFSVWIKKSPAMATATSGNIFSTVVTICILPVATMPRVLIQVPIQMADNPVSDAANALPFNTGKKVLNALTSDTANAALEHQIDIQ